MVTILIEFAKLLFSLLPTTASLFCIVLWVGDVDLVLEIIFTIVYVVLMIIFLKIDCFIRDIDGMWPALELITLPLRFILQLVTFIAAIVCAITQNKRVYFFFDESFFSLLFGFCIDGKKYSERPAREPKERFGEDHIKIRNILGHLFIMLPLTGLQAFMSYLFFKHIAEFDGNNTFWEIIRPFLWIIISFVAAMIITKIKGHAVSDEFWNDEFKYKNNNLKHGSTVTDTIKGDDGYSKDYNEHGENVYTHIKHKYDPNINDYTPPTGYTKESGGWTPYIRLITIVCFLLSPIMVFFQAIAFIISLFVNPYEGGVISWYGDCWWANAHMTTFEKILHFLLGIVVVDVNNL